jgi:lipopolysaccharide transport system permease protein
MRYVSEVWSSRELLANLTLREIRGQYKRTIFGQLWSLANPLAAMLIYTFVFLIILRIPVAPGDPSGLDVFALWLLCGLLPWTFFANVVNVGMGSLIANAGLIQKVYFPRIVLPLSTVGSIGFNWLFEMFVLIVALTIAGAFVLPWILPMIVVMVLLALFGSGIALMLAVANVHFRDTQYFMSIFMQIWFYLTPVVYPGNLLQSRSDAYGGLFGTDVTIMQVYEWNPMERFVAVFRQLLYDNRVPETSDLVWCAAWAVASFVVGVLVFRKNEKGLAEAL